MNKKISDLTAATTPLAGTELLEIVQGGTSKKVAASDIGAGAITAKDEGTNLTTALTSIDFVGAGVTATNTGGAVTVTVPSSAITAKDEGTNLTTALTSVDFVGAGVTATNTGGAVTVTIPGAGGREILSSARTYYVRTDGSDSNDGLANTSGGAFLTIQKAIDTVASSLDIQAGVVVTIQVADGTYTGANVLRPFIGAGSVMIQGNNTTPANVVVSTTSAHCFATYGKCVYTLKDMKLQTTTSGWAIVCAASATITHSNMNFGACANGHMYVSNSASIISSTSYAISGSAPVHVQASIIGSWQSTGGTVTLTGTPAFSTGFAVSSNVSAIYAGGTTYSGSATGKRYDATLNATISSNGGGSNFFPGDSAGTTATGGQYA